MCPVCPAGESRRVHHGNAVVEQRLNGFAVRIEVTLCALGQVGDRLAAAVWMPVALVLELHHARHSGAEGVSDGVEQGLQDAVERTFVRAGEAVDAGAGSEIRTNRVHAKGEMTFRVAGKP